MASHRTRTSKSLATRTFELAFAVPQVMAHRMARMAAAAPRLSARDRKEFQLMGTEKVAAFVDSWSAMVGQAVRANQALGLSMIRAFWSPRPGGGASARLGRQWQDAALGVMNKGLGPVHRTAMGNAKRLGRMS